MSVKRMITASPATRPIRSSRPRKVRTVGCGRSARGFQSVTVHAPSCVVAGSASTIAMLKGAAEGLAWLRSLALPHLCVLDSGEVVDEMGSGDGGL